MILELLFAFVGLVVLYNCWWKRRSLPPGPMPIPLIGNGYQLSKYSSNEEACKVWREKYGDTFTIWIGERPMVCVCDFNAIIHNFVKHGELFQDRPDDTNYLNFVGRGLYGILQIDGEFWKNQRRFSLHTFRNFGLGKNLMEERVIEECDSMFERIEKQRKGGNPLISLVDHVDIAVGSIINNLLFGYRYNENNLSEFFDLKERATIATTMAGTPPAMICRPNPDRFKNWPILGNILATAKKTSIHLLDFFKIRIQDHVEELKNVDLSELEPTDFVAAFLKERHRLDSIGEEHFFSDQQLLTLVFDLWVAGQETTSNTIGWALGYLVHHPEVQRKAQEELDRVIGSDRTITMSDRPDLQYMQALCNEVQRIANMVPLNIIHATSADVVVDGYHLKKGTAITPLIGIVLYDEKIFPDPMKFKPERFLDKDGKVKRVDEFIPFSVGKRQCLGEGLARMEIFLVVANLLNKYTLLPGKEMPDLKRRHGVTVHIRNFECRVEPRFK
ncbi:unnamed protein product [Bursaphelenchus xylophilus]|uniref:(pine wood nematode) hypothetical protein n=1 Tax=Bursaphelenchus xylophilus TaxID=6326 RepID=A0A1I7S4R6_BURXY|nr:unnamed protein product [Bursaphelenchus xylophilus]CAG9117322.1 unnamed protein product [Bursaphelenchus xylophilus]